MQQVFFALSPMRQFYIEYLMLIYLLRTQILLERINLIQWKV